MSFGTQLSVLCAKATSEARGDPAAMSEIVERLLHSTAFAIAIATAGDREAMQEMLTGAESYLTETAAGFIPIATLIGQARR